MGKKFIRNWFSNMHEFQYKSVDILFPSISYKTPEHHYQAMKSKDQFVRLNISLAKNGIEAKKIGRRIMVRDNWDNLKVDVMTYIQRYRFNSSKYWACKLLEDGSNTIVEFNNWHDNFWGDCICDKCTHVDGKNNLGIILTNIRDNPSFIG